MEHETFEAYLKEQIGLKPDWKPEDRETRDISHELSTKAILEVAGGNRNEQFFWPSCPNLREIDLKRLREMSIEYFSRKGYKLLEIDFEDIDFEKDGRRYFARFDYFPTTPTSEPILKFSLDKQIQYGGRISD